MYAELKRRTEQSPALGEHGSRVQSIDLEAQALFEDTLAMMLRMESKTLQTRCNNLMHWGRALPPRGGRETNHKEDNPLLASGWAGFRLDLLVLGQ